MVKVKSFSVGNGDMFYINHTSDNFTIIDCRLPKDDYYRKENILNEIKAIKDSKGITRFISTHPDQDHIRGLKELDERINILNFYCVENEATKKEPTTDFQHYRTLRDNTYKSFYLKRGSKRKWINQGDTERHSSGLHILWPILNNYYFQTEQANTKDKGLTPNNISPIFTYKLNDGATLGWMGDLETEFMDNVVPEIELPKINVLFAPHHGRKNAIVPEVWLDQMNPEIIVIGEGPEDKLADYEGYNILKQNNAGNINFYLGARTVDIFVENPTYNVGFLGNNFLESDEDNEHYIGSLEIETET